MKLKTLNDFNLLVVAYYDGPLEGMALSKKNDECFYFKLIAWDKNQDKRLFILSKIESHVFEELSKLLVKGNEAHSYGAIWVPEWKFENRNDAEEADKIIEYCQSTLFAPEFFILGDDLKSGDAKFIEMSDKVRSKLHNKLKINIPDELEEWLPVL